MDRAVKDLLSARGEDRAYAGSHVDDVLSSMSRDLANRFSGDNFGSDGDVELSDAERSGNGWLRDTLKDDLSENPFDMIRWSRLGDRDDINVGWKFVEDVATCRCLDSGMARHVRTDDERKALWNTFDAGESLATSRD